MSGLNYHQATRAAWDGARVKRAVWPDARQIDCVVAVENARVVFGERPLPSGLRGREATVIGGLFAVTETGRDVPALRHFAALADDIEATDWMVADDDFSGVAQG